MLSSVIMKQSMNATNMSDNRHPTGQPNLRRTYSVKVKPSGQVLLMYVPKNAKAKMGATVAKV